MYNGFEADLKKIRKSVEGSHKKVADKAGVNISTVYRVLMGLNKKPDTIEKVLAAAKEVAQENQLAEELRKVRVSKYIP